MIKKFIKKELLEKKKKAEEKLSRALKRLGEATMYEGYFAEHENAAAEMATADIALYSVLISDYKKQIYELGSKEKDKNKAKLEIAWLIKSLPKDLKKFPSVKIQQGYVENEDSNVKDIKVRHIGSVFSCTVKYFAKDEKETGYCREESLLISEDLFNKYYKKCKSKVEKIRYFYLLENGLTAEVDIYCGNLEGFSVVEVEFPNVEEYKKFSIPSWFGKEVTDSKGIYPPLIANMNIEEVERINSTYRQKPHEFN